MLLRVDPIRPAPRKLRPAVDALGRGGVIIYPTDTGYALGCAISSAKGITRLRKLKGIDDKHPKPLTMLVNDVSELGRYGHLSNSAFRLVRRVLPGPFTMVMRATTHVPRAMKNRDKQVGIRVPDHAVCRLLVELLNEPLLTGSVTAYDGGESEFELEDGDELERRLGRDVDCIIDGGPLWPNPSTVLRLIDEDVEVLRQGQGELPT